jgi:streptogramin lyase
MRSSGKHGATTQASKQLLSAQRKRLHFGVALVSLLLLIGVSTALADEPGEAGQAPSEAQAGAPESLAFHPGELTDSEAAEELPHDDLGRDEALELMTAVFDPALQNPAGIYDELDVEEFHADNVAVIAAGKQPEAGSEAAPSDEPTLLTSTIPLATRNPAGEREAVDLSLEHVGGELQPVNPLVDVGIPGQLDQGISLPDTGIEINLADVPVDRAPSIAETSTAFFPNVAPDTDLTVAPTPDGVETLTQLRSPDAPRSQTFELSLPGDADLVEAEAGGAKVIQGGKAIVVIPPPTAYDAEGAEVPVSLDVSGKSLTITASPAEDSKYPVLVDPLYEQPYVWMWNHSFDGIYDWKSSINDVASPTPWAFEFRREGYIDGVGFFPGLSIQTTVGTVPTISRGRWTYYVPRYDYDYNLPLHVRPTSYIKRMMLKRLWFKVDGGTIKPITSSPGLKFGIWNEPLNKWTSEGVWWGTQGNLTNLDWEYNSLNPDNQVGAKFAKVELEVNEPQLQHRRLYVGEAAIELSDSDAPELLETGLPAKWVNTKADSPLPFTAVDPGLGVREIVVKHPNGAQVATKATCTGISSSPCPRVWSSTNPGMPTVNYAPDLLPQGENWVKVEAVDPIGKRSPEEGHGIYEPRINVDHTQPKLALSGTLTEHSSSGTKAPQYTLKYLATDGDHATATPLSPFGLAGTGPGQMQRPIGVAIDGSGNVWVLDRENNRVMKFDETGKFLMQFGSLGSANGQFNDPRGIAVSPDGVVWVSEFGNKRVQAFNSKGEFIRKITYPDFNQPYGLAVGPGGVLWVSDIGAHGLYKFSEEGTFIRKAYGLAGSSTGGSYLTSPTGLATDVNGNVWVADNGVNRLQKFDSGGEFVTQFGATGTGNGQFQGSVFVAVAKSGNLMVTDDANNRVQEFQPNGVYLRQFGSAGTGSGQLKEPRGIAINSEGTAFVIDAGNRRVAKWSHADLDPQSGAASTEVKVDGQPAEPKYAPGCAIKDCTISREWTVDANDYTSGQHKVEVIATDGVGLLTTKELTLAADSTAPKLTAISSFFTMPKGWVEQKTYSYSTTFSDVGGYGVTSLAYKLDGKVAASTTQTCPSGGCSATLSGSINMAAYSGGAHPAELIATDAAGNVKKFTATVNVDPKGPVSTDEVVDTLEAVEETSPVNLLGESEEEAELEGTADGLGIEDSGGQLQTTGTQVPMVVGSEPEDGMTLQILPDRSFAGSCETASSGGGSEEPEEPEEESEEGGEELDEPCLTSAELEELESAADVDGLTSIELTPTLTPAEASDTKLIDGVATIAANTENHADTVIRPLSDGGMTFENIRDRLGPESFSWEVHLESGQELEVIDDRHAQVYFEGKHPAFSITAIPAHDAVGTSVPTKVTVTNDHIVTLTVEHRSQTFVYPVIAGAGWEGGFQTFQVEMPPPEDPEEEEEWEELGVKIGEDAAYVRVSLSAQGPPLAHSSISGNLFSHRYKFSECRFRLDDLPEVPVPPKSRRLIEIQGNCMRELDPNDLFAGMALRGWYWYRPGKEIWTNASEEDCKKWGPYKPAMVHCEAVPRRDAHHVVLYGNFRFPAGTLANFIPAPECDTLWAVLTIAAPHKHEREAIRDHVEEGDPCDWPQR